MVTPMAGCRTLGFQGSVFSLGEPRVDPLPLARQDSSGLLGAQ